MKRLHYILSLFVVLFVVGCELEPEVQISENPTPPAMLTPANGQEYNFTWENDADSLLISYAKPDYGFPVEIKYTVYLDVNGGDFAKPKKLNNVAKLDTAFSITVGKLNGEIKKLNAVDGKPVKVDLKVVASINSNVDLLSSEVITITFVPYSEPKPLTSIFMIGAAVGGWDTALAAEFVPDGVSKFKHIWYFDNANGSNFRFFTAKDWGKSLGGYDVFTVYPSNLLEPATADSDPNFNFIGTPGWYLITVDTKNGVITMEATKKPGMYLTGDATHGWNWNEPVSEVKWIGFNIWEGEVSFIQNNAFRLFPQKDWGPTSYGWDVVTIYDDAYLGKMEGHDDPNWQFKAATGTYKVTVNMNNKSIKISDL